MGHGRLSVLGTTISGTPAGARHRAAHRRRIELDRVRIHGRRASCARARHLHWSPTSAGMDGLVLIITDHTLAPHRRAGTSGSPRRSRLAARVRLSRRGSGRAGSSAADDGSRRVRAQEASAARPVDRVESDLRSHPRYTRPDDPVRGETRAQEPDDGMLAAVSKAGAIGSERIRTRTQRPSSADDIRRRFSRMTYDDRRPHIL